MGASSCLITVRGPTHRDQAAEQCCGRFSCYGVADCGYGQSTALEEALWTADVPYVLALRPSTVTWAPINQLPSPEEAARGLRWRGPAKPGGTPIQRTFRDGHTETWWAADLMLPGYALIDRSASSSPRPIPSRSRR